ncbi:SPOR domain-containing protein [Paenibacillus guangzhouensis]|uniref:SPOR domain-containing protein n=1 Tax=Paenibacillus guangzhouensis TaxID=1473112 RepID=UPI00187B6D22|nr:SPOR domain-containing protein [Paenibacillus guangzhouensis]
MSKAKMTFRFDDPPRKSTTTEIIPHNEPVEGTIEPSTMGQVVPIQTYSSDYGAWDPSFDEETNRIEKLIRGETSSLQPEIIPPKPQPRIVDIMQDAEERGELSDSELQSDQEEGHHIQWTELSAGGYYRKTRNPSWVKVVASVAGAIVTGAVFGFVVLSLFQGEVSLPGVKSSVLKDDVRTSGSVQTSGKVVDSSTNQTNLPSGEAVSVTIQRDAKTYYMLQYGVFKDQAGVNAAQQELTDRGLAAFGDTSDQNRVYAGMAASREEAQLMKAELALQGIELYIRDMQMPETTQLMYAGDAAQMEQFFKQSDQVVQILLQMSTAQLERKDPTAYTQAELLAIKDAHQKWTELGAAAAKGLPTSSKEAWGKMTQSMNTAILSLNEYGKQLSTSHLWSIQAALMAFVKSEQNLIASMQAA